MINYNEQIILTTKSWSTLKKFSDEFPTEMETLLKSATEEQLNELKYVVDLEGINSLCKVIKELVRLVESKEALVYPLLSQETFRWTKWRMGLFIDGHQEFLDGVEVIALQELSNEINKVYNIKMKTVVRLSVKTGEKYYWLNDKLDRYANDIEHYDYCTLFSYYNQESVVELIELIEGKIINDSKAPSYYLTTRNQLKKVLNYLKKERIGE